jgi:heme/copper-type cytochrome/quinol oxidase subunit 2
MQKIVLVAIGIVVLGAGFWFYTSSQSEKQPPEQIVQQPKAVTYSLALKERKLTPDIVTVTQGDQVTIKVMSDESGEFHVSGYEIENDMTAGTELTFSFTADKAGRYNFELHPKAAEGEEHEEDASATETAEEGEAEEDIVIGAFVVNPR